MKIDFENDLKLEIKRVSSQMGIKLSNTNKLDEILLDYLTVRNKLIDIKKRKVNFNPEFLNTLHKHPKRKEIQTISQFASIGKNLNIFQSKRLVQTKFYDHLSSEWNIYHFHLSLKIDKKTGFVKQGKQLLFAYIDDDQIIFLGTDFHKNGIFANKKWIEILHDYFPKVIAEYKDETILDIRPKVSASERQILWDKGYSFGMTKIRNTIYHNPGIGRATSGHSMTVVRTVMSIKRWIYNIEKQINEMTQEVCDYLRISVNKAEFKIRLSQKLELIEKNTNIKLLDFPEILLGKDEIVKRTNTLQQMYKKNKGKL